MWFPTMFDRMNSSNATSICDGAALAPVNNKNKCDISNHNKVYFETFIQAVSTIPGNLIYFLLVDVVGRKLLMGMYCYDLWLLFVTISPIRYSMISEQRYNNIYKSQTFNGGFTDQLSLFVLLQSNPSRLREFLYYFCIKLLWCQ